MQENGTLRLIQGSKVLSQREKGSEVKSENEQRLRTKRRNHTSRTSSEAFSGTNTSSVSKGKKQTLRRKIKLRAVQLQENRHEGTKVERLNAREVKGANEKRFRTKRRNHSKETICTKGQRENNKGKKGVKEHFKRATEGVKVKVQKRVKQGGGGGKEEEGQVTVQL